MVWTWKEHLDTVLVPSGLLIMFGYHLFLLHRHLKLPHTTTMGHDNHYMGAWVEKMMQVESKDRSQALTVINSNISAAFNLSSISLVLSSLIGTWIRTTSNATFTIGRLIYGNTSQSVLAIKHISLLICFLVAFASFVQSARCYVHSNFLITMPNADIPMPLVQKAVVAGSNFWTVGMRALYFATPLLLWVFGPIPMFVASVVTVVVLYNLDSNSTPLLPFQLAEQAEGRGREILKKIGQEMSAVIEQHGRP
ncbi:hypothetical protein Vadar_014069 [Vaccinium darrowii]|uniref:Uncharacterized protein n=1 Tax=Vaccinium darrowii TaxID=229202 RepID=A0ACB7XQY4_9ERIC|nr:hypothetical protein Vadar_014069 [Vaccinium darrowii]